MDNSSIRGRFSLSTTNLTTPIAESTCLNSPGTRSKFNWGEGSISTRSQNLSYPVSEQNTSITKKSNANPLKVSMSPTSRIDPRTYVDIHSNGLASRIVKYHDNSSRLNRSMSLTNLYNKPGQFPVVHLKKNEQQYKAKKAKNLSMTRIAAPEKSVFHGNTLSSILRSGSIVGLQKSDEEISRENRPILHPPPTENEMAPTRSVLEVLKEISRKRINSDELDGTELTKKQCKEQELESHSNNIQRMQAKRQREVPNASASNAQISPEQQVIKKRMCNYNNDIMSSLSSSMAGVNKKKMLEIQSQKRIASDVGVVSSSKSTPANIELSSTEKHQCIGNYNMKQSVPSAKLAPTTSISNAPHPHELVLENVIRNGLAIRRASEPALNTKPKITLFNKDYDEAPAIIKNDSPDITENGELCGIQFVKPKKSSSISSGGSLLLEKTKKSKLALMLSGLKGELDEEDEVDAIVEKKEEEKSEVNEKSVNLQLTSNSTMPNCTSLFSTTMTSVVISTPNETNKLVFKDSTITSTKASSDSNFNPITTSTAASSTSDAIKIDSISVLSTTSITLPQVSLPVITTSAALPSITSTTTLNPNPIAGGFSFGLSTTKAVTTASVASPTLSLPLSTVIKPIVTTAPVSTSIPLAGTPSFASIATTIPTLTTTPTFTFGAPTSIQSTTSTTKQPELTSTLGSALTKPIESAPTVFGQPSTTIMSAFSILPNTTTKTLTTETASPANTSALTTNFDLQKSTWNTPTTSSNAQGNTNSINGISSFGAGSLSTLSQPTTNLSSNTKIGGFAFTPPNSTEAPKTLFGNIAPTNTTSTNANTTFSFTANKTPATQGNSIAAFTFGAGPSQPSTAAPNTALTFGTTIPSTTANTNPQSVFGNTQSAKPSNTFSFGSPGPSASSQNGAFTFSSSDKPIAAVAGNSNSVGGFSFNNPSVNFIPVADSSKNIFGAAASTTTETKPSFNFGSATTNSSTDKPTTFGGSTNIFGTQVTSSTPQTSAFTFGSTSSDTTTQGSNQTANPFGSGPSTNLASNLGPSPASNSIFGAQPTVVAQPQQSSTFTFTANSSTAKQEMNKPAGGFVFGSNSSIGSNAPKPAVDMNKTFVFGDTNTLIKPAPSSTSVFGGGSNASNNGINGATENKIFSFGGSSAGGNSNTFAAGRQTVNPAPAFNFGGPMPDSGLVQTNNMFVPGSDRPIKKATRRLHKT